MRCGNVLLRSVDSVVAGIAIEHRKTIDPEDDAVDSAEVNTDRIEMARRYLLWRCRKEPFMLHKDEASTWESLCSPPFMRSGGMSDNQIGKRAKGI